ncbi:putative leader peptide [Streptomyces sp. NPDC058579]
MADVCKQNRVSPLLTSRRHIDLGRHSSAICRTA